ncbi:Protein of unknown function (DUF3043) [Mumia flava]|uniref:DUF3043 family protein n=1 Tax=Mumia flava TaxID=1348852 RepID=A0A0B2B358_9ACTN|nr:DUF3043 domain-containing protein [Mumia flava]PJJ56086.1 Protein of unknown function (DUF3043) [Mumia flava]
MFRRNDKSAAEPIPEPKAGGKGRPTPTRKEAEAARKAALKSPGSRKEQAKADRARRSAERGKIRQAMETGDDRYLPARDRGPVRRFVRDTVDSRRNLGEYLMPVLVVILLMSLVPAAWAVSTIYTLWLVAIVGTVIDSFVLVRKVKRGVRERFPDASTKGLTAYALLRSTQIRRLRLPKPQVRHGDKI